MSVTFGPKLGRLINANSGEAFGDSFRTFLRAFDSLVQGTALDTSLTAPPATPTNGDTYLIQTGTTPTGAWAGQAGKIAVYSTEITSPGTNTKVPGWEFYVPREGWQFYVTNQHAFWCYNGDSWYAVTSVVNVKTFGAVGDGVTDDTAAIMAAYTSLPPRPGTFEVTTASGKAVRPGILFFPAGTYLVSSTLLFGPYTRLKGAGWELTTIQLKDGVATSGSEMFVIDFEMVTSTVSGSPAPTAASTFGTAVEGLQINCNGGFYGGTNAFASGLRFYGAQGSQLGDLVIQNFGMRGIFHAGGNSTSSTGTIWIFGGVQGPGFHADTVNGLNLGVLSTENINPSGTYLDTDGDPNGGLLIYNSLFSHIDRWQAEGNFLCGKFKTCTGMTVGSASLSPGTLVNPPTGLILSASTVLTDLGMWSTFKSAPNLYQNAIDDRVLSVQVPGNLTNNPTGRYRQDTSVANNLNMVAGVASSSANKSSAFLNLRGNVWSGTISAPVDWSLRNEVSSGVNGTSLLRINPPQAYAGAAAAVVDGLGTATNSANYNSAPLWFRGSSWNGTGAINPYAFMQLLVGAGSTGNQTQTLAVTQGTSTGGSFAFRLPSTSSFLIGTDTGLSRTAIGTIALGNGTQGDVSGKLQVADLITKGPSVDVRAFGAKGDGIADDSAAVQAAIAYITSKSQRPPLYFPAGTYNVHGLTWTDGIRVHGDGALHSIIIHMNGYAEPLFWQKGNDTGGATTHLGGFQGMQLKGGSQTTALIYMDGRVDHSMVWHDIALYGKAAPVTMDGISVADYLNWHLTKCRWDGVGNYCVNVRGPLVAFYMTFASLDIHDFTLDTNGLVQDVNPGTIQWCAGLLHVNMQGYGGATKGVIRIDNGEIEINQGLTGAPPTRSLIRIDQDAASGATTTVTPPVTIDMTNVTVNAANATNHGHMEWMNFKVISATYRAGVSLRNVYGYRVAEVYNNDAGSVTSTYRVRNARDNPFFIAQWTPFNELFDSSNKSVNHFNSINRFVTDSDADLALDYTVSPGDIIEYKYPFNDSTHAGRAFAYKAVQTNPGFSGGGFLVNTTGTITSGSNILTLTGALPVAFHPSTSITVVGAGTAGSDLTAVITSMDYLNNVLTLSASAGTSVTNGVVKNSPSQLFAVDMVQYGAAAPTTGTYQKGDKVLNTSPTNGIWGWICTAAGTPGTWKPMYTDAGAVNVRAFGAKGDGVTNDTAALQAAINASVVTGSGYVFLPAGTYNVTQLTLKSGTSLIGVGMQPANFGGTAIQQIAGTNLDLLISDPTLLSTQDQHWSLIKNLRLLGNPGDTIGSGITMNARTGEGFKLEHLHIASFPESGVKTVHGCQPFYCEDLHIFSNGKYGIDLQKTSGDVWVMTKLNFISGDDNALGLIHISGGSQNGDTIQIFGVKAETINLGRQNNVIVLDNLNNTIVHVAGLSANSTVAANAAIRIQGTSAPRLKLSGVAMDSGYPFLVDDAVNSVQLANGFAARQLLDGEYIYPDRIRLDNKFFYVSGGTGGISTGLSSRRTTDTDDRIRLGNGIVFGDGAGTFDVSFARSAVNQLALQNNGAGFSDLVMNKLTARGGAIIGTSGTTLNTVLAATATLTFTSIAAQTSQEQTITLTGASTTNFGVHVAPAAPLGNSNLIWSAWVSGVNTISVRVCNPTIAAVTPSAVVWGVTVIQ